MDAMSEVGTPESCTCGECVAACEEKPGWFAPGEAAAAAALLGLPPKEFFDRYLVADYWIERDGPDTLVLSPAWEGAAPGARAPSHPLGRCVFLDGGRCRIHAAKPLECREAWCRRDNDGLHPAMARRWRTPEAQAEARRFLHDDD
jgi:Fe-S-cluster containining protein